jgi:3-oxoacyl-[acyl-carrier-protein] synthase-3
MQGLKSVIRGVGHHVPARIVTNQELQSCMETTHEWIVERTGIHERRFVEPGTRTSDLAENAVRDLFARTGLDTKDIDYIIFATLSPDYYFPGVGPTIQHRMGFGRIPSLDIRTQCSGFVYGLSTADALIRSGQAKRILLICSEVQSPVLDLSTAGRDMAVLFGDGAGAVIIEAESGSPSEILKNSHCRGIVDSIMGSDGSGAEVLMLRTPGSATPGFITHDDLEKGLHRPRMDGRTVFKNAVTRMSEVVQEILTRNQVSPERINLMVPHQANLRINEFLREKLGFPKEKVFNNIEKYGNTTAATIPICLSEAEQQGRLKKGDLVLTVAFGAGFTWGANLIRW